MIRLSSPLKEKPEIHECIDPSRINKRNINEVERMLASHTWRITAINQKPHNSKIFIKYSCIKCETERLAFVEWIPATS